MHLTTGKLGWIIIGAVGHTDTLQFEHGFFAGLDLVHLFDFEL